MSVESAIVSFTVQKLGDALIEEAKLLCGVEGQIQSLKRELELMYCYLKDVDERIEEGNEALRVRIKETTRISFRIEDVIDSFILGGGTMRRKSLLQRYVCCFNFIVGTHKIAIEIKAIKTRIRESTEMFQRYQVEQRIEPIPRRQPWCDPNRNDDYVVGFENDTTMLVEKLTTENDQTSILCIVGMGGSGKTTLARKLYNHQIIKRHFKSQAWVSVSQEWNTQKILVEILRQATGHEKKQNEIGSIKGLRDELRKYFAQTSYLMVLDDVWKKESLQDLLPAFPIDIKRNRIIITTRNCEVVQFPNLFSFFHEPPRLNESESWELFSKIALYGRQSADIEGFKKLGEQMLKKCDGLPLAIVALGGILGAKETIWKWERVSKVVSARVMEAEGGYDYGTVKNMLALSYQELPYNLKPCFLYFALFPEDHIISTEDLINMWVAEGFVTSQLLNGKETLEDVAEQFVDELVQRCVIQVSNRDYEGRVENVRIHDLMRDLCIKEAKKREFLEIFTSDSSVATTQAVDGTITQSRRVSICTSSTSSINIPDQTQNSHVRSVFVFENANDETCEPSITQNIPRVTLETMHKNFRLLKVLCFVSKNIVIRIGSMNIGSTNMGSTNELTFSLPDEIGNLTFLRYLKVNVMCGCKLSQSLENLRNLLTFDFFCSSFSQNLPNIFWKMEKLRHLIIDFNIVPVRGFELETLKNLQTLSGIMGGDWMLKEMSTLSPTVTKLCIHGISSMEQLESIFQCPSVTSGLLQILDLKWNKATHLWSQKLELLCRCDLLHKLSLTGRISEGPSSPVQFPSNLVELYLYGTSLALQETMSTLGKLSNLRNLSLWADAYIGNEWTCSASEFPQLFVLRLTGLQNLEGWRLEVGAMPRLSNLTISSCWNMKRLPEGLRHIAALQKLNILSMPEKFYERLRQADNNGEIADQGGEDLHIIQHIPIVRFR